jgi:hypothetical protein
MRYYARFYNEKWVGERVRYISRGVPEMWMFVARNWIWFETYNKE